MRIRCIDEAGMGYLTLGKVYPVVGNGKLSNPYITVIADNGDDMEYFSRRFEAVQQAVAPVPNQKPVDLLEATRKFLGR